MVYIAWKGNLSTLDDLNNPTRYCQKKKIALIIECDRYAHHVVWGSTDIHLAAVVGRKIGNSRLPLMNKNGHFP